MEQYDEETHEYFKMEMMNSEDVDCNGDFFITYHTELPSFENISEKMKKKGFDTVEVTHVKEVVKRYQV